MATFKSDQSGDETTPARSWPMTKRTRNMTAHEDQRHETKANGDRLVLRVLVRGSRGTDDEHQSESAKLHEIQTCQIQEEPRGFIAGR